jgi:hypothetical protein
MPSPKASSGRTSGLTEVKLLFTAGSLATILLGWGALAVQARASQENDPLEEPPPAVPPSFAFLAEPLPTIAVPAQSAGAVAEVVGQETALRAVSAPPPVQIITVNKPGGSNNSRGGGGRTQSSK